MKYRTYIMILCNCNITISHSSARCWPREFLFCHFIGFGLHFCESTVLSDYFSKCGNENICKYKAVLGKACFFFHCNESAWRSLHSFACFAALICLLCRAHALAPPRSFACFIHSWVNAQNELHFFYKNSLFSRGLDVLIFFVIEA